MGDTLWPCRLGKMLLLHFSLDENVAVGQLPPPQAFPRLSGDWGTREHAGSAREGSWERA